MGTSTDPEPNLPGPHRSSKQTDLRMINEETHENEDGYDDTPP